MAEINVYHILIATGSVLLAGGITDIIRRLYRIERKQDEATRGHHVCREELLKILVHKEDFDEWKCSRDEIWGAINTHEHDSKGRVVRKK